MTCEPTQSCPDITDIPAPLRGYRDNSSKSSIAWHDSRMIDIWFQEDGLAIGVNDEGIFLFTAAGEERKHHIVHARLFFEKGRTVLETGTPAAGSLQTSSRAGWLAFLRFAAGKDRPFTARQKSRLAYFGREMRALCKKADARRANRGILDGHILSGRMELGRGNHIDFTELHFFNPKVPRSWVGHHTTHINLTLAGNLYANIVMMGKTDWTLTRMGNDISLLRFDRMGKALGYAVSQARENGLFSGHEKMRILPVLEAIYPRCHEMDRPEDILRLAA